MFLWREQTSALAWRLDFVYACFVIYYAMIVVRLAAKFVAFAGPGWRDEVADDESAAPRMWSVDMSTACLSLLADEHLATTQGAVNELLRSAKIDEKGTKEKRGAISRPAPVASGMS